MEAVEKQRRSNAGTLVWIPDYHGIPGNEADKFAKEGTNGVPPYQTVGIPLVVGKEVNRGHLRQQHLNRWKTCTGCRQSKTMSEPLASRKEKLQAISRQKFSGTVGLSTGGITLTAHMFKLGLTQRQDC
jgi:hypothetical protein